MKFWQQVALECSLMGGVLVGALAAIGARTENARAIGVIAVAVCTATYCIHVTRVARKEER